MDEGSREKIQPRKVLGVRKEACKVDEAPRTKILPQLKNVHAFVLFTVIFFVWIIYGFFNYFPAINFISYFSFSIVFTNLFKDSTFLNSITAPFAFLSTGTAIVDLIGGTPVFFIHAPSAIVIIIIINLRRDYSLGLMMAASLIYSLWMYSILQYSLNLADPIYSQIPEPFDDAVVLGSWIAFGTFVTSFLVWLTRSRCKSALFPWAKKTAW